MKQRVGKPESFGYTRLPSHDCEDSIAYERPNGIIVLFPRVPGKVPLVRRTWPRKLGRC